MHEILSKIEIKLNESIYVKDPNTSELGKRIVSNGIDLIAEIGFEHFTFKKLGQKINSPEASIYRYFESKYKLLLYITSWYWRWMEHQLLFALANIESPHDRLKIAIRLLTGSIEKSKSFPQINKQNLFKVLIEDSNKSYLNRSVDDENSHGVFADYKQIVERISQIILEINSGYKYPHMLISTAIEGARNQRYFADHLPKLTDLCDDDDAIQEFYTDLVFKAIL